MEQIELIEYLKETQDYIEYSFYKNSSDIMGAIAQKGINEVLNIVTLNEIKKGIFDCITTWKLDEERCFTKKVIIDISNEMIFVTESLENKDSKNNNVSIDIDIQSEYGEILKLLKSKSLNSSDKKLLIKVVQAFFN
jgi:hypothetical protein